MTTSEKPARPAPKRRKKSAELAEQPPRIARRERRRERSREEIVDATRRVLLRNGIAGTTLDAVAKEVGLTKAALYYYYPSKGALLFEIIYGAIEAQSHAVHDAVDQAKDGGDALRAIIRETVHTFASRLDDFRLSFFQAQIGGPGSLPMGAQQIARIRPLNDLAYAGATKMLAEDWKDGRARVDINPRLMAFLANIAAIGMLTMKGMVEAFGDPLLYTDDELIEGLARIFEAAARP